MPHHQITSDPGGCPIIAGTHVTVAAILKELAASEAVDVLLTTHPELDRDAVQTALAFAAAALPVLEPAPEALPPATPGGVVSRPAFGQEMWALRQAAVAEARRRGEPLLDLERIRREVHARRGEHDVGDER